MTKWSVSPPYLALPSGLSLRLSETSPADVALPLAEPSSPGKDPDKGVKEEDEDFTCAQVF